MYAHQYVSDAIFIDWLLQIKTLIYYSPILRSSGVLNYCKIQKCTRIITAFKIYVSKSNYCAHKSIVRVTNSK